MNERRRHGLGERVAGDVTAVLLRRDVPEIGDIEVEGAVDHVQRSIAAMPASNRLAVDAASALVVAILSGMVRTWFPRAEPSAREAAVARLSKVRAPAVLEFFKLTRGLGLVAVFERRSARARP